MFRFICVLNIMAELDLPSGFISDLSIPLWAAAQDQFVNFEAQPENK